MTNTYDQLLSYVVFADWLFFGLTAGALVIARRRDAAQREGTSRVPGHPYTTSIFIAVAAGVVANSFVANPIQSLIGTAILVSAAIGFFLVRRAK
jgi:APA family basic amino acid/polyamine antiporter